LLWSFYSYIIIYLFLIVNCSDPTIPGNGSIRTYQNTTEGAEIVFGCNPGFVPFVPAGNMTAVCASNGRWNPDPAELSCIGKLYGKTTYE